jgi:hypothetical protein
VKALPPDLKVHRSLGQPGLDWKAVQTLSGQTQVLRAGRKSMWVLVLVSASMTNSSLKSDFLLGELWM